MKTMKRESENCMDFIEAVHRRRVYPLMYCHAELSGSLNIEILKQAVSTSSQFVPEILCAYDYRHNRFIKVYENGNISVRFKFADELRKIVEYIELNTEATTALAV